MQTRICRATMPPSNQKGRASGRVRSGQPMHRGTHPSIPARNRLPTLPSRSFAGGKFQSRKAIREPASAAGRTPSGNQPSRVITPIRPSMAAKDVPQTMPSMPSAMRTHSASATSSPSHSSGAAMPRST